MVKYLIPLFLLLLVSFSNAQEPGHSDKVYEQKLIGKWYETYASGTSKIDAKIFYNENNELTSLAVVKTPDGTQGINLTCTWQVKNGVLISTVVKTNLPDAIPVGRIFKDTILELTDDYFKYKGEDGSISTQRKDKKTK